MSTFNDILVEAKAQAKNEQENDSKREILNHINFLTESLRGVYGKKFDEYNEDELTRFQGEFAVYRSSLSEHLADIKKLIAVIEKLLLVKESAIREHIQKNVGNKKITNKELEVRTESTAIMIKLGLVKDFHEAHLEHLKNIWFGVDKTINVIEHRLFYLRGDRRTSNFYSDGQITSPSK